MKQAINEFVEFKENQLKSRKLRASIDDDWSDDDTGVPSWIDSDIDDGKSKKPTKNPNKTPTKKPIKI